MKKTMLLGGLLAATFCTSPAMAAQNFGGCSLDGNATLNPGLGANTPAPDPAGPGVDWGPAFTYSFDGTLDNCVSVDGSGPAQASGGTISAGEPLSINGIDYLPANVPSGNGGCTGSHTDGISIVKWGDGTLSAVDYSTDGVAAGIGLTGTFLDSITLTRKDVDANGQPIKDTFTNLKYGGDYTGGPLVFHPADPTQCNGAAGVTTSPITGFIGHGNFQ